MFYFIMEVIARNVRHTNDAGKGTTGGIPNYAMQTFWQQPLNLTLRWNKKVKALSIDKLDIWLSAME